MLFISNIGEYKYLKKGGFLRMTAITTAVAEVMTLVESMLTAITGNAILVVVLASGFVRLALSILRKLFKTSRAL